MHRITNKYIAIFIALMITLTLGTTIVSAAHKDGATLFDSNWNNTGYITFAEYEGMLELTVAVEGGNVGTGFFPVNFYDKPYCEGDGSRVQTITIYNAVGYISSRVSGITRADVNMGDGSSVGVADWGGDILYCGTILPTSPEAAAPAPATTNVTALTPAGDLRVALTKLLGEHVLLASSATGAALDGRQADFESAAMALDGNSIDIAAAIGSVYGSEAEVAFLQLWRAHIGFFVDYTVAVAGNDMADKQAALRNLEGYQSAAASFFSGANPNIDPQVIIDSLGGHITTLTAVIDAQAANNPWVAFRELNKAFHHVGGAGAYLSNAIATQFPQTFPGDALSPAVDLRVAQNVLAAEHAYLAAAATDAALGGRDNEFMAAASSLDRNGQQIASAIGSVYGAEAGASFLQLWRAHIDFFVDYTVATAQGDMAGRQQALRNLDGYEEAASTFLSEANPFLPKDAVKNLLAQHVVTLTAVIDAQAAGNSAEAYNGLRHAYGHMQMISDALAEAIVKQFPSNFQ